MSLTRDSDICQWLQNKLGSTEDLWSGSSICSQMSLEKLHSIVDCFASLQPHVKVKIMLSIIHLPTRSVEQWKGVLDTGIQLAQEDADQWVVMVGDILKGFPALGSLNADVEDGLVCFREVLNELRKIVKRNHEVSMLPLECPYLCRSVISAIGGVLPATGKYFALKRKPKSAALRAEILQKSAEACNNLKRNCSLTVPVKIRSFAKELDDASPLRGIPSDRTYTSSGFMKSGVAGRFGSVSSMSHKSGIVHKEGGIKLLDINEQPMGMKEARKRKRINEHEAAEKRKKDQIVVTDSVMPEYACGLLTNSLEQNMAEAATTSASIPSATFLSSITSPDVSTSSQFSELKFSSSGPDTSMISSLSHPLGLSRIPPQNSIRFQLAQLPEGLSLKPVSALSSSAASSATASSTLSIAQQQLITSAALTQGVRAPLTFLLNQSTPNSIRPVGLSGLQTFASHSLQQQHAVALQPQQSSMQAQIQLSLKSTNSANNAVLETTPQQAVAGPTSDTSMVESVTQANQSSVQAKKPSLQLTKEQMIEAQEMFRTSNKVTRPEKALILGFMAGSRDNPVPSQGDIVNIRLSAVPESVQQVDGSFLPMTVETYFQMNYATGDWKRVRKVREYEPEAE